MPRRLPAPRRRRWQARSTRAQHVLRRRRTVNSCSPTTIRSDGLVSRLPSSLPGEEALKPRLRIICDEHLTGAPRDGVQARLELWLKSHIERVLEPLFRLAAADDVTGIGRGIAYQLIEALGVLDRQRMSRRRSRDWNNRRAPRCANMASGSAPITSICRRCSSPPPRALATQLWALKHGIPRPKGSKPSNDWRRAGAPRSPPTRMSTRRSTAPQAIASVASAQSAWIFLERLADLIRAALAWRAGASGTKPPGAIDGFGFTVTAGMTSLAGCSGEDFASVLRSLGYRAEKRAEPAAPAQFASRASHAESGGAARAEVSGGEEARSPAMASQVIAEEVIADKVIADEVIASEVQLGSDPAMEIETLDTAMVDQSSPGAEPVDIEPAAPAERSLPALAAQAVIEVPQAPTLAAPEHAVGDSPDASTVTAKTDEMATTQLIEVWRPIRRDEHARSGRREQAPRRGRTRRSALSGAAGSEAAGSEAARSQAATSAEVKAAPAGGGDALSQPSAAPEASSLPKEGHEGAPRHGRHGRRDRREPSDQVRSPRTGRPPDGRQADARTPRAERGGRQRSGERSERTPRGDRPDRDPDLRAKYIKGRGDSGSREHEPDPNSPFAKLAKLKEQLEAGSKEPR